MRTGGNDVVPVGRTGRRAPVKHRAGILAMAVAAALAAPARAALPPIPAPSEFEREIVAPRAVARRIVVEGARVIPDTDIRAITAGFEGRALSEGDLRELESRLTQLYVGRGYATSGVLLKSRPAEGGDVVYAAVEGGIAQVRFGVPPRHASPAWLTSRLVPEPAEPVRLDDLQDRMTMLRESGVVERINAELVPMPGLGAAELVVAVEERRPWDVEVRYDNHHSPVIGARRASFWFDHRNVTGWGDRLDAHIGNTPGLEDYHVAWMAPVPRTNWRVGVRFERSDSLAIDPPEFRELAITSVSDTRRAEAGYSWVSTATRSLVTSVALERRTAESRLLGLPFSFVPGLPDGITDVDAVRLAAEQVRSSRDEVLYLRGQWSEGRSRRSIEEVASAPASRFRVLAAQLQYARQLSEGGVQLVGRLDGQWSRDSLVPIEKKALGGAETVRGFRENVVLRDTTVTGTLEVRWPLWKWEDNARLVGALFTDAGWGRDVDARPGSGPSKLASVGVGLALALPLGITARVDAAYPNLRWLTERADSQDRGIHFRLSWVPPLD